MASDDLRSAEEEALREVNRGMRIPYDIEQRLIEKKYIEQRLGGVVVTGRGTIYLATHKKL